MRAEVVCSVAAELKGHPMAVKSSFFLSFSRGNVLFRSVSAGPSWKGQQVAASGGRSGLVLVKEGVKRRNQNTGEMVGFFHRALIALVTWGGFCKA